MFKQCKNSDAVVFAILAGGVPVEAVVVKNLQIPLDVAVVSRITFSWNTEAGYAAVAFDGTARVNRNIFSRTGLSENEVEKGIGKTIKSKSVLWNLEMLNLQFRWSKEIPFW